MYSDLPDLAIENLHKAYRQGACSPRELMYSIRDAAERYAEFNIWIHLLTEEELEPYLSRLYESSLDELPLWGIPFAIKDNIDLKDIPTTAACAEFAYTPSESAHVVQLLIDAGAVPIGKTNLDQFATGLNGTRSPWGACKNAFNPEYVSGGSSSGSAVAVAKKLASFSLGTDTAGSGRVPAAFNHLVGVKTTRGLLSATGLVPACKSLDCISIFALNCDDANTVLRYVEGFDERDEYSRENTFANSYRHYGERIGALKIGVIPQQQLEFFGDNDYREIYFQTLDRLSENNVEFVEVDYAPFSEAAKLLYEGPWVTERYIAIEAILQENPEAVFPVVRSIIEAGRDPSAAELFRAQYRLAGLKQHCLSQLATLDGLLTPTVGTCFTIEEMLAEPVLRNSQLGYYTNFMNLLDLSSLAVPVGMAKNKLPFGITLVAPAFHDRALLSMGKRFENIFSPEKKQTKENTVSSCDWIDVLVCGAHLEGLPLNWQLTERGAILKAKTKTAKKYQLYALAGGPPHRPGLIKDDKNGTAIEAEIWSVPAHNFGSFVAGIPAPLGIGKVEIVGGELVSGFICEPYGIQDATDITQYGGWRDYLAQ